MHTHTHTRTTPLPTQTVPYLFCLTAVVGSVLLYMMNNLAQLLQARLSLSQGCLGPLDHLLLHVVGCPQI